MKVFPARAKRLGLDGASIRGVDFPLHAPPESYRAAVSFLKGNPKSPGALVTTHKVDLCRAARDLFDVVDRHALLMGETSCLSKQDGQLACHAEDPTSSGLAIDGFLPDRHFERSERRDAFDRRRRLDHRHDMASDAESARRRQALTRSAVGDRRDLAERVKPCRPSAVGSPDSFLTLAPLAV